MRPIDATSVVFLLAVSGAAHGQVGSALPLFEADAAPLAFTIEAPFRELRRNADEREELDGILRYRAASGDEHVFDVEIRVRGKSRLDLCSFPPLRVDFDRDAVEGTVFSGQDHLKLVTLCRERNSYREYLAQEYQVYKAYNAVTDFSFRVRWAEVEYVVTDGRRAETFTEPAFFIEEDWEVAQRHGLNVLDVPEVPLAALEGRHGALLALFQYLIANTDWSAINAAPEENCCHNGKPIGVEGGPVFVLPYDFDQAGLIATDYASPRSHLPIRSVRQRLYRGYCTTNGEVDWAVQRFNDERAALEREFDAMPEFVDARTRERTLKYVADFYEVINAPEALREEIIDECRE
ncbi:MAG TPA: hypothetical protein VKQ06_00630 [Gammaproteobacteria bacterium]|nr:hypothetical protein [Gammaproteobacteria bacterium]